MGQQRPLGFIHDLGSECFCHERIGPGEEGTNQRSQDHVPDRGARSNRQPVSPNRSEVTSGTRGARRCNNPECEHGGRRIVGGMRVLKNGKFSCLGKGCHTVYMASEVIDPANDDYGLYAMRQPDAR